MKMQRIRKKGFTLIELIIVVSVLAIIAVIAIPIVGDIVSDAKVSTDAANVALFEGAIEREMAEGGAYPADAAAARLAIIAWTNLEEVPLAAQGGTYDFFYNDNGNHEVICAASGTNNIPHSAP